MARAPTVATTCRAGSPNPASQHSSFPQPGGVRRPRPIWLLLGLALAGIAGAAEPTALAPLVVTASRAPQPADRLPVTVDTFDAGQLRGSPALALDDTLRDSAAFGLFRRSGSLTANPTAQGFSVRGLGPSGASRSLVLLDGIPLNDPFGGWVAWNSVPRSALARAELVRGGGSGAWGNAALGGTLQLFTAPPPGGAAATPAGGRITGFAGENGLRGGDFTAAVPAGRGGVRVSGAALETDGFIPLDPAQRGPVDRPLGVRQGAVLAGWTAPLGDTLEAGATVRGFDEERGNGTVLQQNRSRLLQAGASLAGRFGPGRSWSANAYAQRQHLASFFSSVGAGRATETPANDQFDVPATAWGAAAQATWQAADATTTLGADLRRVAGETNEDFLFSAGRFTRRRVAGGEQQFAGAFIHHERALGQSWRGSAALRVDRWENTGGHRRETDLATGAAVRDERYADRAGTEFSPQLGIVRALGGGWRARAAAYRAFRVPTLNEYHRPFRVGIINTEANPALKRETLDGAEAGVEFAGRTGRVSLTAFTNDLRDAVGNVTLSRTPAAISRQRQNLDRVRVRGVEFTAEWRPRPALRLHTDWLVNDATVRRASAQPALEGRRLPQVPRLTATAGAEWTPTARWTLGARLRHAARQFEDDENLLPLAAVTTVDAQVTRALGRGVEVFVAAENLLDARVETGRSNEGVATLGSPRQVRAGLSWAW